MYQHSWAEIDLDHLKYNIRQIEKFIPVQKMMSVVKANAYGHTCKIVVPALQKLGISRFAVSNEYEALDLRSHGVDGTVLVLGRVDPAAANELADADITVTVFDSAYAAALQQNLETGKRLKYHLKLDTGMGRLGLDCREHWSQDVFCSQVREILVHPALQLTGAFTHFPAADFDGDGTGAITTGQYSRFLKACALIKQLAGVPKNAAEFCTHCSNSAATLMWPQMDSDFCRVGIIQYGCTPSVGLKLPVDLKPVLSFKTVVSQVKEIKPGETVSYGRAFQAKKATRVATIAVGYADGYMRGLSEQASVMIRGRFFPLIGRICMDQAMVDVTAGPEVTAGDEVELFGSNLPVEQLAKQLGTINYELICAVSHRVPRVVIENGQVTNIVRYESY